MNPRERILAVGLLGLVLVGGGGFLFHQLFWRPLQDRNASIAQMEKTLDEKRDRISLVLAERSKLERWKQLSLPADTDVALREYEKYLSELLRKNGFTPGSFKVEPKQADAKGNPTIPGKGPIYTKLSFHVTGHATLEGIVRTLEAFYRTSLMHEIKNLTITRPLTTTGPQGQTRVGELDVVMMVEALIVNGAESRPQLMPGLDRRLLAMDVTTALRGGPAGLALVPWAVGPTGPLGPGRLAQPPGESPRRYASIAAKNIFMGQTQTLSQDRGDDLDVTQFVRLTTISDDGRRVQAFLYDRYNGGQETRLRASAGFDSFRIRDSQGEVLVQANVVKIDPAKGEVILRVDEKYYALHIGDDLDVALRKPLAKDKLKALGLVKAPAAASAQADDVGD